MTFSRRISEVLAFVGVMVLLPAEECWAQGESSFEWGGYAKSLIIVTKPALEESLADYLLHLRLNTAWHPFDELTATMELRVRAYAGGSVVRTPGFVEGLQNPAHAWDLDGILWSGRRTVGFGEIDRLALTWSPPGASIAVGRQRIAWGTNLVWNPIDIFNPLSVLDFDYEERPAVDAVRVQWYTGAVSKLEGAVKAGRSSDDMIAAGMWSFTLHKFDLRACAGARGGRPFVGGGWAGDILGGGFRGEILGSDRAGRPGRWGVSVALSGDYTFPSTLYVHTELLMNSEGTRSDAAVFRTAATERGLLSPARYSIYQEVAMDVTPLVRTSLFGIVNPDDGSSVLVPSVSWNATENMDLMTLCIFAGGRGGTEYGEYGRILFLRLRYSF